jgi:hypothetical protein
VAAVSRNIDVVAGSEPERFGSILELQDSGSLEEQDPLGVVLIVPEGRRRGVAVGDDTFDSDVA